MGKDMMPYLNDMKKKEERRNSYKRAGLGALGLAVTGALIWFDSNYIVNRNTPEIYKTGYHGDFKPHVIDTNETVWGILKKENAEGEKTFWISEMGNYSKNPEDLNFLRIGDTVWVPKDLTLDQRKSK